jgi:putative transposase
MRKSRFKESQIIGILKEVESGRTGQEVCRQHDISEPTLCRWKKTYGGMEVSDAKRVRELEETNSPSDSLHEWTDFGGRSRGAHGERVEVELADSRVGTEQVMAAKGASGDHHGVAAEHESWLSHGHGRSTNQAVVAASQFNPLRERDRRISSNPTTDTNPGGVAQARFIVGLS